MGHLLLSLVKDMRMYATAMKQERWLGDDAAVINSWADEIENFIKSENKR